MTAPLHAFPLKVDWLQDQPPAEAMPFPDPIVSSRDGLMPFTMKPVEQLEAYAKARGLDTLVQYACGYLPSGVNGKPLKGSRDSFSIRMQRKHFRAVALYVAGTSSSSPWSWQMLYTLTDGESWTRHPLLDSFKAAL